MDNRNTILLETLASNHTVIVFDNRGLGNTTSGNGQPFSVGLFANDTAGLLDALDIKKADVLGWSLGGAIAQEFALTYPDKVGRLVLYAIGCGGADFVPPSQEFQSVLTNGTGTSEERIARIGRYFPKMAQ